jgi:chromosome segregation ATPase
MRLFNQTNNALNFEVSGIVYECEPFGSLMVDDALVPFITARGVPLAIIPVAPEVRAHQRVASAQAEITDKQRAEGEARLAALVTENGALRKQLEEQTSEIGLVRAAGIKAEAALAAAKDDAATLRVELAAAEAALQGQAGAESDEAKALTAEVITLTAAQVGLREELATARRDLATQRELTAAKDAELVSLSAVHANTLNDKKALEELLEETAGRASDFEKRAVAAEGRLEEQRSKREKRAPS